MKTQTPPLPVKKRSICPTVAVRQRLSAKRLSELRSKFRVYVIAVYFTVFFPSYRKKFTQKRFQMFKGKNQNRTEKGVVQATEKIRKMVQKIDVIAVIKANRRGKEHLDRLNITAFSGLSGATGGGDSASKASRIRIWDFLSEYLLKIEA